MPHFATLCILCTVVATFGTSISICKTNPEWFCVDNSPTHVDTNVTGLLLNSRMIQGVFDDANASSRTMWAYPNKMPYDSNRQTAEFAGNMSAYSSCGLDAFTVGMQGGGPLKATPYDQPNESSGFFKDGTPDPVYLARLAIVLQSASITGLTPIVSLL